MEFLSFSTHSCFLSMALLLLVISSTPAAASQFWNQSDRSALLSFKSQIINQQPLSSWNESLHHCHWQGITCSSRHPERVTTLDLQYLALEGTLSPSIGNLTFLKRINLSVNHFQGEIPHEIGRLFRLQYLYLGNNSLEGEIPGNISRCSNLREVNLRFNKLSGKIPVELSSVLKLEVLLLHYNNLIGNIPSSFGNLSSLTKLNLYGNQLEGKIPENLCRIRSLEFFEVAANKLSGEVPHCLYNNSNMNVFDVSRNQLEGSLPSYIGLTLPNIQYLNVEYNNLVGNIPSSLGNLSSLADISIQSNHFQGSIPNDLCKIPNIGFIAIGLNYLTGKVPSCLYNHSTIHTLGLYYNQLEGSLPQNIGLTLPKIERLLLESNQFTGPIPVSLTNATSLIDIDLGANDFSGSVPRELGRLQSLRLLRFQKNQLGQEAWDDFEFITSLANCSNLETLEFSYNILKGPFPDSISNFSTNFKSLIGLSTQMHGNIPEGIGNLVSIEVLGLSDNYLTGKIPSIIGKLSRLQKLVLSGNMLSRRLPASFGNMTKLTHLHLGSNSFGGSIPLTLGNCKNLAYLNLSHNKLIGSIPTELTNLPLLSLGLSLEHNYLNGSLPSTIGNLINLIELDVSENKLSGHLPESLGECLNLAKINMRNNCFEGEIPNKSLSTLKGLEYLDLSQNSFSGKLPEYLEHFPLRYLNLSLNDFEGPTPETGIFGNASMVSIVGNKKLCGGTTEMKLPPCFKETRKTRAIVKVIIYVTIGCICFLVLLCFFTLCSWKKVARRTPSSATLCNQSYKRISYSELHKATDGFSTENLIGSGSYGTVFKGNLQDFSKMIAVKVFRLQRNGSSKSFLTECNALRNLRHRNLLKIITSCSSIDFQGNDFKALVFYFMPNGSLDNWLHGKIQGESRIMSFLQRLKISIDVASALEYLHQHHQPSIVHCDVKPSNVLLDEDMTACLGDFGIAKILSSGSYDSRQNQATSYGIKGSMGYVAPEYGMGGEVTTQGDVYSYGILLLEIFTKKKPTDDMFVAGLNLHNYAKMALPDQVIGIIDPLAFLEDRDNIPKIVGQISAQGRLHDCLVAVVKLGVACSAKSHVERMTMSEVTKELYGIMERYQSVRGIPIYKLDGAKAS